MSQDVLMTFEHFRSYLKGIYFSVLYAIQYGHKVKIKCLLEYFQEKLNQISINNNVLKNNFHQDL